MVPNRQDAKTISVIPGERPSLFSLSLVREQPGNTVSDVMDVAPSDDWAKSIILQSL